jgi:hypothetical protein
MPVIKRLALILVCALAYYFVFYLNKLLFDTYEFSFGVNWIFIPSGIQLLLVLIAISDGALGVALASIFIGFENYYLDSALNTVITGLIAGGSPLLSRKICIDLLHVDRELVKLTPKAIFQMSIFFAVISATLHQVWFFNNGKSDNFLESLLVMAIGDLLGTALVLSLLKLLTLKIFKARG